MTKFAIVCSKKTKITASSHCKKGELYDQVPYKSRKDAVSAAKWYKKYHRMSNLKVVESNSSKLNKSPFDMPYM